MQIQALLDQLCVDLGFCLPPDAQEELCESPGTDVDAFTDRVIVAEGLDPIYLDGHLRRQIRERVARVLDPQDPPWPPERPRRRRR